MTAVITNILLVAQVAPPQQGAPDSAADAAGGPGVARISLLNGDVSVKRGDSGEYVAAVTNAPVMVQDSVQTALGARAEVQFDNANLIRLAQNTEVRLTNLQNGIFQMQLGRGTVTFRVLFDVHAQVEVDTPSVSVRPTHPGVYRITVTDDGQTYVTPRNGQVEVFTPKGAQVISAGQTLTARGSAADPEYQLMAALGRDSWDDWSDNRDRAFQQAEAESAPYVSPDIDGTEELSGRGRWVNTPDYGYAWTPVVAPDWTPYSVGRWVWSDDDYGWTWLSGDPWGWAPYHYGRWFNSPGIGWCWWPGRIHDRHFWSPALVGFFGYGGVGVGFGFGRVGWVPLAPFERFSPWWGHGRVSINNVNIVRNTNITTVYRNARIGNGAVSVSAQQFGHGAAGYTRVSGVDLRSVGSVRGAVPITPTSQATRYSDRSTGAIARTNFAQSRFASHMATPPTQRSNFASSTNSSIRGQEATRSNGNNANGSTWDRFGQTGRAMSASSGTAGSGESAWTRFGTPRSAVSPSAGRTNPPAYTGATNSYRGSSYSGASGRSQLQVSPPLVRERSATPSYSAPRAPAYSAPRAPVAPRQAAPSGGGHASGGSAPSHGGGGSGHRR